MSLNVAVKQCYGVNREKAKEGDGWDGCKWRDRPQTWPFLYAEKINTDIWELSDREKEIIKKLGEA